MLTKKTICTAVLFVLLVTGDWAKAEELNLENLDKRISVVEFEGAKPTPPQEVYDALDGFYTRFQRDFRQGVNGLDKIGTELAFIRREVSVNTIERTINTREIGTNKGEIKSLWNAITLNRALLVAIFAFLLGIVRKLYKKDTNRNEEKTTLIVKP